MYHFLVEVVKSSSLSKCVTSAGRLTGSSLRRHSSLTKSPTGHVRNLELSCSLTRIRTISFVLITILRSGKSIPLTTLLRGQWFGRLKSQFTRHEIPETSVSDNGSQFTPTEFKEFSHQWIFVHKLPFNVLIETKSTEFQYGILNRYLTTNSCLYKIGLANSPLCKFCKQGSEPLEHL